MITFMLSCKGKKMYNIEIYIDKNGNSEIKEYIENLKKIIIKIVK